MTTLLQAYAASSTATAEGPAGDDPNKTMPEEEWGQKVACLAQNGADESPRKFRGHVRRALVLYILLLTDARDLDALRGVIVTLRTIPFASYADVTR